MQDLLLSAITVFVVTNGAQTVAANKVETKIFFLFFIFLFPPYVNASGYKFKISEIFVKVVISSGKVYVNIILKTLIFLNS